jgi:hypothetical protein
MNELTLSEALVKAVKWCWVNLDWRFKFFIFFWSTVALVGLIGLQTGSSTLRLLSLTAINTAASYAGWQGTKNFSPLEFFMIATVVSTLCVASWVFFSKTAKNQVEKIIAKTEPYTNSENTIASWLTRKLKKSTDIKLPEVFNSFSSNALRGIVVICGLNLGWAPIGLIITRAYSLRFGITIIYATNVVKMGVYSSLYAITPSVWLTAGALVILVPFLASRLKNWLWKKLETKSSKRASP